MVRELLLPGAHARVLLLINHVLDREPVATQRLRSHAGRTLLVELVGLPAWLPVLPPLRAAVTSAGLFEPMAPRDAGDADLTLSVAVPTPLAMAGVLAGDALPEVRIGGDAQLAADMHWLVDNVRWDLESDLSRLLGAAPARLVMSAGRAGARALRRTFGPPPSPPQPDGASR